MKETRQVQFTEYLTALTAAFLIGNSTHEHTIEDSILELYRLNGHTDNQADY